MAAVKAELMRMEQAGVISRVTKPTDWCAGMVVVPKINKAVRICVDLTKLNRCVKRERHLLPTVEQALAQLTDAAVFSKLDANSGFWQIPLAADSALLTTFITPFGRFCFHRLPFGITSAPEHFQRRMSEILEGLEGVICNIDDTLIYAKTQEEHDIRLKAALKRLQEAGVTLNKEKCQFSVSEITFLGHIINKQGIRPDPTKLEAINQMEAPKDVANVRRLLGTINQLGKFIPNLAQITEPIWELLVKSNQWSWEEPQETSFTKIKQALTTSPVLAHFNPNYETILSADSSSYGLGAVLLQQQPMEEEYRPVAYISRSLTPTETRYAQIEKEALAFTWACERLSHFLTGLSFHINTDHKPLVPLFSSKKLEDLPLRLQRFRLRMMRYNYTISHVPGKQLVISDTLSRAPARSKSKTEELAQETGFYIQEIISALPISEARLKEIQQCQQEDRICQEVSQYCQSGWPNKKSLPLEIRPFYQISGELSVEEGLLLRQHRIVIPQRLRPEVMAKIYSGHQGIQKCRERAGSCVWWPRMSKDLEEMVLNCEVCRKIRYQHPEPLISQPLPELPWQKVATDLFTWQNHTYLLIIDYYSRYIEIAKLNQATAEEVVNWSKSIFARHGVPETVISDNGPQFSSQLYAEFSQSYQFQHITSSPYYPQSNGEAERGVGIVKQLLKKEKDPYLALMAYRSTPLQNGYSPAELLMSRKIRTDVPISIVQRRPVVPDVTAVKRREEILKNRQKKGFDIRHRTKELSALKYGEVVWLPRQETEAVVGDQVAPRSYELVTSNNTMTRRNRRDLVQLSNPVDDHVINSPIQETQPVRRSNRVPHPPLRYRPDWT
jgi:transposase InsO family protein